MVEKSERVVCGDRPKVGRDEPAVDAASQAVAVVEELREEQGLLKRRVGRLEGQAGRGLIHPGEPLDEAR